MSDRVFQVHLVAGSVIRINADGLHLTAPDETVDELCPPIPPRRTIPVTIIIDTDAVT